MLQWEPVVCFNTYIGVPVTWVCSLFFSHACLCTFFYMQAIHHAKIGGCPECNTHKIVQCYMYLTHTHTTTSFSP